MAAKCKIFGTRLKQHGYMYRYIHEIYMHTDIHAFQHTYIHKQGWYSYVTAGNKTYILYGSHICSAFRVSLLHECYIARVCEMLTFP